jgi:hypothetical protein
MKMKRTIALCVGLILFGLTSMAGASDVRLTADPSVPAATGKAHLSKDKNGNIKLKIEVHHLAKPEALTPAKQAYVVWMRARGKDPQNLGVLKVNDKLEGTFETTVLKENFDVFITAEDNPTAQVPTGPELLKGTVQL